MTIEAGWRGGDGGGSAGRYGPSRTGSPSYHRALLAVAVSLAAYLRLSRRRQRATLSGSDRQRARQCSQPVRLPARRGAVNGAAQARGVIQVCHVAGVTSRIHRCDVTGKHHRCDVTLGRSDSS